MGRDGDALGIGEQVDLLDNFAKFFGIEWGDDFSTS